ncbi:hypothetical protein CN470_16325 [Bacillus cereus]|nr:hypothetical protein CN470_16325 [Bacillus cereus]PFS87474.1 hypothetical protein COK58_29735 [Bacillus cereus]
MFYGSMHFFIHSYPIAVLGFLFVTGLSEKLYKILHVLSMRGPKCWRYSITSNLSFRDTPHNEIFTFLQLFMRIQLIFSFWGKINFLS